MANPTGKAKRDLYLVPDEQLPQSGGDLADQVETIGEVTHERQLNRSWEAAPGMTGDDEELRTPGRQDVQNETGGDPGHVKTVGSGNTSGTSAGLGAAGRGKPSDSAAAGMTGSGAPGGVSGHGSSGNVAVSQPGTDGGVRLRKGPGESS